MRVFSFPNLLSLLRLPLAAMFLLVDSTVARIAVVGAAALSDFADGYFARRMRSHDRRSGQLIDPITDKLFVLISLIAFVVRRELTFVQLLIVLARDIYNSLAFFWYKALKWRMDFRARLSGKTVTVLQLALLLALLFWRPAVQPLIWIIGAASLFAIVDYTRAGIRKRRLAGA